jgi:DNA replication and repair protein RecF
VRLVRLATSGFRNLESLSLSVPPDGVALLGPNGHGKTNLLEAVYYPVLFRSFRGAVDAEITKFEQPGFGLDCQYATDDRAHDLTIRYTVSPKRKRITTDGADIDRLADAVGRWLAVAFTPDDTSLISGPAGNRRQYLDRLLSLADREYLVALSRYRAALSQRNAALKQRAPRAAAAFEPALAAAGATVIRARVDWVTGVTEAIGEEFLALGETARVELRYRGDPTLADPDRWPDVLAEARHRDESRSTTTVGPHRDDLIIELDGRPVRTYGSTGQQRSAAVALKLLEWDTLARVRGVTPALLLDDVFAELDGRRQACLAERLQQRPRGQLMVSAPRRDELPAGLDLPIWEVEHGAVRC